MNDFLAFLHASGSPFHAVKEIKCKLLKAGYVQLMESQAFQCVPGGKYFVTRNQSSSKLIENIIKLLPFKFQNDLEDHPHFILLELTLIPLV
jgi:aspartyl aminopeptidase